MGGREEMIQVIRQKYKLEDRKVLSAMLQIPREDFVPEEFKGKAYADSALDIGFGQTISQPFTTALMTHLLHLSGKEAVLEIGTGSGYQTAVLSLLASKVFSIEIIPELGKKAQQTLTNLGYRNIRLKIGNGKFGWKKESPFDAIIITSGLDKIPQELFSQLKFKGVLAAPIGNGLNKVMTKFIKQKEKLTQEEFGNFHFVPFIKKYN